MIVELVEFNSMEVCGTCKIRMLEQYKKMEEQFHIVSRLLVTQNVVKCDICATNPIVSRLTIAKVL